MNYNKMRSKETCIFINLIPSPHTVGKLTLCFAYYYNIKYAEPHAIH